MALFFRFFLYLKMSTYDLFFSFKCPMCKKLIMILNNNQMTNNIDFYDIEKIKIPPFVQKVPTLIIKKEKKLLSGSDALNYFINIIKFKNQNNQKQEIKQLDNKQIQQFNKQEPKPYISYEMNQISEIYGFN